MALKTLKNGILTEVSSFEINGATAKKLMLNGQTIWEDFKEVLIATPFEKRKSSILENSCYSPSDADPSKAIVAFPFSYIQEAINRGFNYLNYQVSQKYESIYPYSRVEFILQPDINLLGSTFTLQSTYVDQETTREYSYPLSEIKRKFDAIPLTDTTPVYVFFRVINTYTDTLPTAADLDKVDIMARYDFMKLKV